jgi:hypothetical protein
VKAGLLSSFAVAAGLVSARLFVGDSGQDDSWIRVDGSKLRPTMDDYKIHMICDCLVPGRNEKNH